MLTFLPLLVGVSEDLTLGPEAGLEDLVFCRKALAFVDPRFNMSAALVAASLGDGGDGKGDLLVVASRLVLDGGGVLVLGILLDIRKRFLLHGGVLGRAAAFFLDAFFLGFVPR